MQAEIFVVFYCNWADCLIRDLIHNTWNGEVFFLYTADYFETLYFHSISLKNKKSAEMNDFFPRKIQLQHWHWIQNFSVRITRCNILIILLCYYCDWWKWMNSILKFFIINSKCNSCWSYCCIQYSFGSIGVSLNLKPHNPFAQKHLMNSCTMTIVTPNWPLCIFLMGINLIAY